MSKRNGFFKFVVPSVLAFALSGVYTIVDGFFIGNSLGDAGLASITLGYPISAFVQAAGTGIGLSGAIRFTILRGQQKEEDAKRCLGSTVLLFALTSMLLTGLALLFLSLLLRILGAEGEVLGMTAEYVRIIALGAVFQIFSTGLVPFSPRSSWIICSYGYIHGGWQAPRWRRSSGRQSPCWLRPLFW